MGTAPRNLCGRRQITALLLVGVTTWLSAAATATGAPSSIDRPGNHLLRLGAGDRLTVKGTSLHCAVSAQPPATIVCGEGSAQSPRAGSYAFAVADTALLVLKASSSSTPTQVRREPEPHGPGGTYPGPPTGGRSHSASVGTIATVGGTHIFCAVERLQGTTYVTCGPANGSAIFFPKSYVGAVSERDIFVIRKLDRKRTKTVFRHRQP